MKPARSSKPKVANACHGVTLTVAAAIAAGGCSGSQQGLGQLLSQPVIASGPAAPGPGTAPGPVTTGSNPPPKADDETAAGSGSIHVIVAGSRLSIYEKVARNALTCWLGGEGPLKGTHVFGAEVPPDNGDNPPKTVTEIGIYQRDTTQPAARGLRAFRITFEPHGDSQIAVDTANSKFRAELAAAMGRDVESWARGHESCQARAVQPPPAPVAEAPPAAKKASAKTKKPANRGKAG